MTEDQLIRRLERLRRDWPEGYTLASMGGTLCLFGPDKWTDDDCSALDQEKVLWSTTRIPNTGGDW